MATGLVIASTLIIANGLTGCAYASTRHKSPGRAAARVAGAAEAAAAADGTGNGHGNGNGNGFQPVSLLLSPLSTPSSMVGALCHLGPVGCGFYTQSAIAIKKFLWFCVHSNCELACSTTCGTTHGVSLETRDATPPRSPRASMSGARSRDSK